MTDAARQLDLFIDRYDPPIAALGRAAIALLRRRMPGMACMIYDNYNALVAAFSTSGRGSNAVLSIALYPRWVTLFLAQGALFDDPKGLLKGGGSIIRHVVLDSIADFDRPEVADFIDQALARARVPLDPARESTLVIQAVSARQRPRRPTAK